MADSKKPTEPKKAHVYDNDNPDGQIIRALIPIGLIGMALLPLIMTAMMSINASADNFASAWLLTLILAIFIYVIWRMFLSRGKER